MVLSQECYNKQGQDYIPADAANIISPVIMTETNINKAKLWHFCEWIIIN